MSKIYKLRAFRVLQLSISFSFGFLLRKWSIEREQILPKSMNPIRITSRGHHYYIFYHGLKSSQRQFKINTFFMLKWGTFTIKFLCSPPRMSLGSPGESSVLGFSRFTYTKVYFVFQPYSGEIFDQLADFVELRIKPERTECQRRSRRT